MLLVFSSGLMAQTTNSVVEKLNVAYDAYTSFSAKVSYAIFVFICLTVPVETLKGIIAKQDGNHFSQIGEVAMLSTKEVIIQVDRGTKSLIYMPNQTLNRGGLKEGYMGQVDAALKGCKHSSVGGASNKPWIEMENCMFSTFSSIKIYYNPNSYAIKKMILFNGVERLEISYSDIKINKKISLKTFNTFNYLVGKKEAAQPNTLYKNYVFENYFKQKKFND